MDYKRITKELIQELRQTRVDLDQTHRKLMTYRTWLETGEPMRDWLKDGEEFTTKTIV